MLHLACVIGDVWAPYPKWLGTVVGRMPVGTRLAPPVRAALAADGWRERQDSLAHALTVLYEAQRSAGLPVIDGAPVRPFYDRPFLGVDDDVLDALRSEVRDPFVRALPPGIGAIEQWCDGPAVLMDAQRRRAVVWAAAGADAGVRGGESSGS